MMPCLIGAYYTISSAVSPLMRYCRVVSKSVKFGYDPFVPLLSRTLYRPAFCLPDVDAPVEDSAPRALRYSMMLLRDPSMSLESMDFE